MSLTHQRQKVVRQPIHGVLLLDKPLGLSSNQALQKAKWLLRAVKAGHTGTLDPLATGVLPLCFGAATKFAQIHLDADKRYQAVARLGVTTDTGDSEGQIVRQVDAQVTQEQLMQVLPQFRGEIEQTPPMYSALKHEGKALYEYARAGIEIERKARAVTIYDLKAELLSPQEMRLDVHCSKGTYIRTLASDMGDALGCGASLVSLRRVASGLANIEQSITLEELEKATEAQRISMLKPPHFLLEEFPKIELDEENAGRFLTGLRRRVNHPDTAMVQVWGVAPQALLGIAEVRAGELIPKRLLAPTEIKDWLEQINNK